MHLRFWRNLLLGIAASLMLATAAQAQVSHHNTPLMVVRFNQPNLYYQQQLFNVVSRALDAKPDVMFNIISLVPETPDANLNQRIGADARNSTGSFVANMVQMGIPQNRIRVSYQPGYNIESNEVHLFVE
jgi:hypothetical protein